jgi:4-phytase / acid phosphatase
MTTWREHFTMRRLGILATAAFVLVASPTDPVSAQAAGQQVTPILTIIVTRHGVRSYATPNLKKPTGYNWACEPPDARKHDCWDHVKDNDLTLHGYRLMTLMGGFYKEKLSVDCSAKNVFVYADTVQRTLATAHALVEGMCGLPKALDVFHKKDVDDSSKDPIFNATDWLFGQGDRIDLSASLDAVTAAAGGDPSRPATENGLGFSKFQRLLDTRCGSIPCDPISKASSSEFDNEHGKSLWTLKGPMDDVRTYSEDVFLEYAQCRPLKDIAKLDDDKFWDALRAGIQLHVVAYAINARNANHNFDQGKVYNPYVQGATLLWHIVAILDQKVGRTEVFGPSATPSELDKNKDIVIFSGHDTQLAALGGILDADWQPEGGIVHSDMPPGSALVFDLMPDANGKYLVRLRFASMTLKQFVNESRLNDGISLTPVDYRFCNTYPNHCVCDSDGCSAPLEDFEKLVIDTANKIKNLVDFDWKVSPQSLPPVSSAELNNPTWTNCND